MDADSPVESARQRPSVAGFDALRRAIGGLGACAVIIAVCSLLWRGILDMALSVMIAASLYLLYHSDDRHRRAALVAAGVVAVAVGNGLNVLLDGADNGFARDVACAGLGALAGSQAYAAVTRRP